MEKLDYLVIELEKVCFLNDELLMFRQVLASFFIEKDAIDYCKTLCERGFTCKVFNLKSKTHV